MKTKLFEQPVKTGLQAILLLAILLFNFGSANLGSVHAVATNDNLADATNIAEATISYTDSLSVATYSTETNEPAVPVDEECDNRGLKFGFKTAWYKFTPLTPQLVSFNTYNTSYDTYIAIWETTTPNPGFSDLSFVKCDDDTYAGRQSQVVIIEEDIQTAINNGTTYYIQVAKFSCYLDVVGCVGDPNLGGDNLVFSASFKNIDVNLNGTNKGNYNIAPGEISTQIYSSVNTGPLKVTSDIENQLISSMQVTYKRAGKNRSYSELMGFPANQATTEYYFPWYTKSATIDSQLRIANVGTENTIVDVYIKGVKKSGAAGYLLAPGASILKSYASVNTGPVRVVSRDALGGGTNPMNIITSMRVIYKYKAVGTTTYVGMSYSEMMGYPADQATTQYLFPRYKTKLGLTSQLRVANVGSQSTSVQVIIGGALKGPYTLGAGAAKLIPVFTNQDVGPVRVISTNPTVNVIASMRQIYTQSGVPQSYSEIMGYPSDQLASEYHFPKYTNDTTHVSNFYIVNVDDQTTNVEIYIAGNLMESFTLAQGIGISKSYLEDNGPVRVVSTSPASNIIASIQTTYKQSGKNESYSELLGFPYHPLEPATAFLFPWYTNDTSLSSQLLFGYP